VRAYLVLPSPQCKAPALHIDVAQAGGVGVAGAATAGLVAAAGCVALDCLPRFLHQGRVGRGANLPAAWQAAPGGHVAGHVDAGRLCLGAHSGCGNRRTGRQLVVQTGNAGVTTDRAGWGQQGVLAHCRAAVAGCLKLCNAAEVVWAGLDACCDVGSACRHGCEHFVVQGEACSCWCWQLAVAGHAGLWAGGVVGKRHAHTDVGVTHMVVAAGGNMTAAVESKWSGAVLLCLHICTQPILHVSLPKILCTCSLGYKQHLLPALTSGT
jgi:hypothetical protein